jgi:hypothetical protein
MLWFFVVWCVCFVFLPVRCCDYIDYSIWCCVFSVSSCGALWYLRLFSFELCLVFLPAGCQNLFGFASLVLVYVVSPRGVLWNVRLLKLVLVHDVSSCGVLSLVRLSSLVLCVFCFSLWGVVIGSVIQFDVQKLCALCFFPVGCCDSSVWSYVLSTFSCGVCWFVRLFSLVLRVLCFSLCGVVICSVIQFGVACFLFLPLGCSDLFA